MSYTENLTASPLPSMPNVPAIPTLSTLTPTGSISSSDSEREEEHSRGRPRHPGRKPSGSIIVPRDHPEIEIEKEEFPPGDARAMSPRRNSADVERYAEEARKSLKEQARTLQSSLAALAERINEVRSDHDKLESENRFLQDYIGGLTRTMRSEMTSNRNSVTKAKK